MQAALRMNTVVLPGHRIEVLTPELSEGATVHLIVLPDTPAAASPAAMSTPSQGVWDYLQSLTPVQRTPEQWAAVEREMQEERDSWDS